MVNIKEQNNAWIVRCSIKNCDSILMNLRKKPTYIQEDCFLTCSFHSQYMLFDIKRYYDDSEPITVDITKFDSNA